MSNRPPPFLIGEHRALDFLNSICAPWGEEIEWLRDGADLLAWLEAAGMLTNETVQQLTARYSDEVLDQVAVEARALRERFRVIVSRIVKVKNQSINVAELAPFNALIEADNHYLQAVVTESNKEPGDITMEWKRRWHSPEQVLSIIAQSMLDLLVSPNVDKVKPCQGTNCTLWYLDVSKNQRRRWCSMSVCGNRAKAAAHRARQK